MSSDTETFCSEIRCQNYKSLRKKHTCSPFHISLAAAVHLSTNTFLGNFVRQPQDHLTSRKVARLWQRRKENCQHAHFPCDFLAMFEGRKAAVRQPRGERTVGVRICMK